MKRQLDIAGKRIVYNIRGKGKPVLLVHGFGETGSVWDNQVQYLKDNFLLIVPDIPGSGESESIDDMSMEGMAEVLKKIIDNEKEISDKALPVIGHSMGGYITLAFAEKYPGNLSSFGLFHSTAFADSEEKKAIRRKGIAFIQEHGAFEFLKSTTPNLFSPHTKEKSSELVCEFIEGLNNFSAGSLVSYYDSMIKRPDRTAVLKESKIPILFVMGEYDNAVSLEDGLKQCHLPEKSYIHILHHSGHMGMMEEPTKSNRLLKEFLSAV